MRNSTIRVPKNLNDRLITLKDRKLRWYTRG